MSCRGGETSYSRAAGLRTALHYSVTGGFSGCGALLKILVRQWNMIWKVQLEWWQINASEGLSDAKTLHNAFVVLADRIFTTLDSFHSSSYFIIRHDDHELNSRAVETGGSGQKVNASGVCTCSGRGSSFYRWCQAAYQQKFSRVRLCFLL